MGAQNEMITTVIVYWSLCHHSCWQCNDCHGECILSSLCAQLLRMQWLLWWLYTDHYVTIAADNAMIAMVIVYILTSLWPRLPACWLRHWRPHLADRGRPYTPRVHTTTLYTQTQTDRPRVMTGTRQCAQFRKQYPLLALGYTTDSAKCGARRASAKSPSSNVVNLSRLSVNIPYSAIAQGWNGENIKLLH